MADKPHPWAFIGPNLGATEVEASTTVRTYDPKLGYWYDRPLVPEPFTAIEGQVFPSKWHHDRYIEDLKRNVESCDHRLAHVDDPWQWFQGEPPTSEQIERKRAEVESEKAGALAALERLGAIEPPTPEPKRRKASRAA
jgi:hypothetical protein